MNSVLNFKQKNFTSFRIFLAAFCLSKVDQFKVMGHCAEATIRYLRLHFPQIYAGMADAACSEGVSRRTP